MKAAGRITAALFVSTLVHGAVLVSLTAKPQPEPVRAGKLSVSLRHSSTTGRAEAEAAGEPLPAAGPKERRQRQAPEAANASERQVAGTADSNSSSSKPKKLSAHDRKSDTSDTAQGNPVAESSSVTGANPAPGKMGATQPEKTASANPPGEPPPSGGAEQALVHRPERATDSHDSAATEARTVSADNRAPALTPGARKEVRARLEDELTRYFHYPFVARRRGWEGKVVLRLRIDGHGRIDSTEIAESSGHGILDRAALDAIAKVSLVPGAAERLDGIGLYLELPVIYRLSEG